MTTTTLPDAPCRAELELMLRLAVLDASPREHGREQAARVTTSLLLVLIALAGAVALYDVALLIGIR